MKKRYFDTNLDISSRTDVINKSIKQPIYVSRANNAKYGWTALAKRTMLAGHKLLIMKTTNLKAQTLNTSNYTHNKKVSKHNCTAGLANSTWRRFRRLICEDTSPPTWRPCQNKWKQQLQQQMHLCLTSLFVTVSLSFTKHPRHQVGAPPEKTMHSLLCEKTKCAGSGFWLTLPFQLIIND